MRKNITRLVIAEHTIEKDIIQVLKKITLFPEVELYFFYPINIKLCDFLSDYFTDHNHLSIIFQAQISTLFNSQYTFIGSPKIEDTKDRKVHISPFLQFHKIYELSLRRVTLEDFSPLKKLREDASPHSQDYLI